MCSSRKNPYPRHGRSSEILKEREVFKGKFEAKLEFPGGRGMQNKNLPWREHGYFLELHNVFLFLYWVI